MCQSVWVIEEKKELRTARHLADWLGIKPEELITQDLEPIPEYEGGDWRDACLCPFDVPANLDRAAVFYRRDIGGDPMVWLAHK